ncbi:MAG TPA: copper oxidase, partial [Pseudomonas sp.]|nr:copper oxidase [Pseudomonas sp.]
MRFTRRQVLAGLAGLGVVGLAGSGVRYWLGRPVDVTTHDYELIAAPLDVELVPGHVTPAWAYGGQAPRSEER